MFYFVLPACVHSQVVRNFNDTIKLPSAEECEVIASEILKNRGMPGCIGALDGKHFQVSGTSVQLI